MYGIDTVLQGDWGGVDVTASRSARRSGAFDAHTVGFIFGAAEAATLGGAEGPLGVVGHGMRALERVRRKCRLVEISCSFNRGRKVIYSCLGFVCKTAGQFIYVCVCVCGRVRQVPW